LSNILHFSNWQKFKIKVYYYDRITLEGYSGNSSYVDFNMPIEITQTQEKTQLISMDGEIRNFNHGWRVTMSLIFKIVTQEIYDNLETILDGMNSIEANGHPLAFSIMLPIEPKNEAIGRTHYHQIDNMLLNGEISFNDIIKNLTVGQTTEIKLIKDNCYPRLQVWKPNYIYSITLDPTGEELVDDDGNVLTRIV